MVIREILQQELAVGVRTDHTDHGGFAAELPHGRERAGDLAAALPARLLDPRAFVLLRRQVVKPDEKIHERGSIRDDFFHRQCLFLFLR